MSKLPIKTFLDFEAELSETGVPAVLYKLFANQWSGRLVLGPETEQRTIYFVDGWPVFAEINQLPEELSSSLIRDGLLSFETAESLSDALERGLLGKWAKEQAEHDDESLAVVLAVIVREICTGVFRVTEGKYSFGYGDRWFSDEHFYPQNPIELISSGLRRFSSRMDLAERLLPEINRYVVRTEKYRGFRIHLSSTDQEARWLSRIDGMHTLKELAEATGTESVDFMSFIAILRAADMVDLLDEPRPTAERSHYKRPLPSGDQPVVEDLEATEPSFEALDVDALDLEDVGSTMDEASAASFGALLKAAVAKKAGERKGLPEEAPEGTVPDIEVRPIELLSLTKETLAVVPAARSGDHDETVAIRRTLRTLLKFHRRIVQGSTYWTLLGVTPRSSPKMIRLSYESAIESLPVEHIEKLSRSDQERALAVIRALRDAFNTLIDPGARNRPTRKVRLESANFASVDEPQPKKTKKTRPKSVAAKAQTAWYGGPSDARRATELYAAGRDEEEKGNEVNAVGYYRRALSVDSSHRGAKAGLVRLVGTWE